MKITQKINLQPIGMRTIKTAVSVFVCLALGQILENSYPLYACIAAVLSMQDTVEHSVEYGVSRTLATLLGGMISIFVLAIDIMALNPWLQFIIIAIAVIFTIQITVILKRPDTTSLAVITIFVIVMTHPEDKYIYAFWRVVDTIIGIVVAVIVNKYFNFSMFTKKKDKLNEPMELLNK